MADLRVRGGGRRESGAFLLAQRADRERTIQEWLPYDVLDPQSLRYAYVKLDTEAFPRLWDVCAAREVQVVADIHTHPLGPGQSSSDRSHPMVSIAGHVALIAPRFALGPVSPKDVSFNIYLGSGQWSSFYREQAAALIIAS